MTTNFDNLPPCLQIRLPHEDRQEPQIIKRKDIIALDNTDYDQSAIDSQEQHGVRKFGSKKAGNGN